jgi:hypothetical protein
MLGGEGKDWVLGGNEQRPSEATRTWLEVQATMVSKPGVAQTAC